MSSAAPGASAADDPFKAVRINTDRHRSEHGCWAYPHEDGRILGVLAAAVRATRILELGTALGYTALCLAYGASSAKVDTLERDPQHVSLARSAIEKVGYSSRIRVHEGEFATLLPTLKPGYDVAFFDGYAATLDVLDAVGRLLRPGGLLISANQQLSGIDTAAYRLQLLDARLWLSAPLCDGSDVTLSVWAGA